MNPEENELLQFTLYDFIMSFPTSQKCLEIQEEQKRQILEVIYDNLEYCETEEEEIHILRKEIRKLGAYIKCPPILNLSKNFNQSYVLTDELQKKASLTHEMINITETYNPDFIESLVYTLESDWELKLVEIDGLTLNMPTKKIKPDIPLASDWGLDLADDDFLEDDKEQEHDENSANIDENNNEQTEETEETANIGVEEQSYYQPYTGFLLLGIGGNPERDVEVFTKLLLYVSMEENHLLFHIRRILCFIMLKIIFTKELFTILKKELNNRINKPNVILKWKGTKADFLRIIVPLSMLDKFRGVNDEKLGQADICEKIANSWGVSLGQVDTSINEAFEAVHDNTVLKIANDITKKIKLRMDKKGE